MIAELRRHIETKISQATLEQSPFPHLVIEDFFPNEIYARILAYNPFLNNDGSEWMSASVSGNVTSRTPYHARKQINFHADATFDAEPDAAEFWNGLKACFLDDHWFERVVQQKYADYFQLRFGDLATEPDFLTHFRKEFFLQRHEPGYYIGPHTDVPTRVFTCIFSFATTTGFEEYGTELLAHKDPLVRCWGYDHYMPDDFIVKKVAPYRPNNFLLFFKTRHSFHSVKDITDAVPNQRYGMQFQFYEPGYGLFKDLSVPDLMSPKIRSNRPKPAQWIAKFETHITPTIETEPTGDGITVNPGDILIAARQEPLGGHLKLFGASLNGNLLPDALFIRAADWVLKTEATAA